MYCKNCGKELIGAGMFCQSCGAKQNAGNTNHFQSGQTFGRPHVPANAMPLYGNAKASAAPSFLGSAVCLLAAAILVWAVTHFVLLRFVGATLGLRAQVGMKYASYFMGVSSLISAIVLPVLQKRMQGKLYILLSILTGIFLAVMILFTRLPLWYAVGINPGMLGNAMPATDIYMLSLPVVTLGMSFGFLLLSRGGRACYFVVRAVGVVVSLGLSVPMVLWVQLGTMGITCAMGIAEIITAILFGVFAARRKTRSTAQSL